MSFIASVLLQKMIAELEKELALYAPEMIAFLLKEVDAALDAFKSHVQAKIVVKQ